MNPAALIHLARRYRHLGPRRAVASAIAHGLLKILAPVLRMRMEPSLRQMVSAGRSVGTAEAFVQTLLGHAVASPAALAEVRDDFTVAAEQLADRCARFPPALPPVWAVGAESALALYLVVRLCRPDVIIETGVANGHSSFLLLSALEANSHGRLVSLYILPAAGSLVPERLHARWELIILDRADPIADATTRVAMIDDVDIFFHDGDHSYVGQCADFALAQRTLTRGRLGLLLSDDIDESFAFIDYVQRRELQATVLMDAHKAMGGCMIRSHVTRAR